MLSATSFAHADLRDVSGRVVEAWQRAGADVKPAPTRFLNDDETLNVALPPGPKSGCTTVALLGARGLSFRARLPVSESADEAEDPRSATTSVAGALVLSRCAAPGSSDAPIDHVLVTSEAGRGAVEVVVARSRSPLAALSTILPERSGGSMLPMVEPGELPPLPAAAKRAEQAESRARRDGAKAAPRGNVNAGADGSGSGALELEPGCHRVEVFGSEGRHVAGKRRPRLDIDAELRDGEDETLARDRTEAPDTRLEACVGVATKSELVFIGAQPSSEVVVTHVAWPLPARLPRMWEPVAQARMATALFARHVTLPDADPEFLAQGPSGTTSLPVSVEPGACYVAVAALTHGQPRGLGLRAVLGAKEIADERGVSQFSSAIGFCAGDRAKARLVIEARGTALAWGLALYRVPVSVWSGRK